MRTELKSKFIQHLNRKQQDEAFTLIELLAVIIIIGILSAIAIPNFLNQDVKAKQSEAKQNIVLINKTQNSFRAENNTFATSFSVLAIGSITDNVGVGSGSTTNYTYSLTGATETASILAAPNDTALKGYSGRSSRFVNNANQSVIGTIVCQNITVGTTIPVVVPIDNVGSAPTCAATTTSLSF
jgi:type IV pilus assembly protein PilA